MPKVEIYFGDAWMNHKIRRHRWYRNEETGRIVYLTHKNRLFGQNWKWRCVYHKCRPITGGAFTFEECLFGANKHYWMHHTKEGQILLLRLNRRITESLTSCLEGRDL